MLHECLGTIIDQPPASRPPVPATPPPSFSHGAAAPVRGGWSGCGVGRDDAGDDVVQPARHRYRLIGEPLDEPGQPSTTASPNSPPPSLRPWPPLEFAVGRGNDLHRMIEVAGDAPTKDGLMHLPLRKHLGHQAVSSALSSLVAAATMAPSDSCCGPTPVAAAPPGTAPAHAPAPQR